MLSIVVIALLRAAPGRATYSTLTTQFQAGSIETSHARCFKFNFQDVAGGAAMTENDAFCRSALATMPADQQRANCFAAAERNAQVFVGVQSLRMQCDRRASSLIKPFASTVPIDTGFEQPAQDCWTFAKDTSQGLAGVAQRSATPQCAMEELDDLDKLASCLEQARRTWGGGNQQCLRSMRRGFPDSNANGETWFMDIIVEDMQNKQLPLVVATTDTIKDVKKMVQEQDGSWWRHQRLIFQGNILVDWRTVGSYDFKGGATLSLVRVGSDSAANPSMAQIGSQMKIFVNTLDGKSIALLVHPQDKVEHVKALLFRHKGIQVSEQRLIFAGKKLKDQRALSEYQIHNGATLHLVLRLSGADYIPHAPGHRAPVSY